MTTAAQAEAKLASQLLQELKNLKIAVKENDKTRIAELTERKEELTKKLKLLVEQTRDCD